MKSGPPKEQYAVQNQDTITVHDSFATSLASLVMTGTEACRRGELWEERGKALAKENVDLKARLAAAEKREDWKERCKLEEGKRATLERRLMDERKSQQAMLAAEVERGITKDGVIHDLMAENVRLVGEGKQLVQNVEELTRDKERLVQQNGVLVQQNEELVRLKRWLLQFGFGHAYFKVTGSEQYQEKLHAVVDAGVAAGRIDGLREGVQLAAEGKDYHEHKFYNPDFESDFAVAHGAFSDMEPDLLDDLADFADKSFDELKAFLRPEDVNSDNEATSE